MNKWWWGAWRILSECCCTFFKRELSRVPRPTQLGSLDDYHTITTPLPFWRCVAVKTSESRVGRIADFRNYWNLDKLVKSQSLKMRSFYIIINLIFLLFFLVKFSHCICKLNPVGTCITPNSCAMYYYSFLKESFEFFVLSLFISIIHLTSQWFVVCV